MCHHIKVHIVVKITDVNVEHIWQHKSLKISRN